VSDSSVQYWEKVLGSPIQYWEKVVYISLKPTYWEKVLYVHQPSTGKRLYRFPVPVLEKVL